MYINACTLWGPVVLSPGQLMLHNSQTGCREGLAGSDIHPGEEVWSACGECIRAAFPESRWLLGITDSDWLQSSSPIWCPVDMEITEAFVLSFDG